MRSRVKYTERDGILVAERVSVPSTDAQSDASRRNGVKGGRRKRGGPGRQRRISDASDRWLEQIAERNGLASRGEALDLVRTLIEKKSTEVFAILLTREPE